MEQAILNKVVMNEWDEDGYYEEAFQLPLTGKHALIVGRWRYENDWGVDLRRWSYNESRMLRAGLSLRSSSWEHLFLDINKMYEKGLFKANIDNLESLYMNMFEVDDSFKLKTGLFYPDQSSARSKPYLTINLLNNEDKQIFVSKWTTLSILIRFDQIEGFIIKCREAKLVDENIVKSMEYDLGSRKIDSATGKEIF